ncbi:MAG: hypothetical protein KIT45_02280 [Fimbriimonadia bacterium]|nr:hypothetical protein [Fimbriimonadia bacterium]
MGKVYVLRGVLKDDHTIVLDEGLPFLGPVQVTVHPLPSKRTQSRQALLEQIYTRQRARGHQPPTPEEVDRRLEDMRDGWVNDAENLS